MSANFDLFVLALAERINRLWSRRLELDLQFQPCQPLQRFGVEVMVGLPAFSTWQALKVNDHSGLAVIDRQILLGAVDRLLGGEGSPPQEVNQATTLMEEAIARKLIKELLLDLSEVWRGVLSNFKDLQLNEEQDNSPWESSEVVIETSFKGGWKNCQGILRFLWPRELVTQVFGDLEFERVAVDYWKPLPWQPDKSITQMPSRPSPQDDQPSESKVNSKSPPEAKKRIAFDDFEAMVDSLNT